jgi:hypothetical protein
MSLTLKAMESRAVSAESEIFNFRMDGRKNFLTWHAFQQAEIRVYEEQAERYRAIEAKTKDVRRKKRAQKGLDTCIRAIAGIIRDIRYNQEIRAKRKEDRDAWQAEGWRPLNVIDSGTFSTQPWPLEYAASHARREQETLKALGYESRQECPDYQAHRIYDSYWGTTYNQPSGHVVILVKVGTELELELAKRAYKQQQAEYWKALHEKYKWDLPIPETRLRDWK